MNRKKTSNKLLFDISFFWFGLEFCWQSLLVIIFPVMVLELAPPEFKGRYLALIMAAGAIISMLVQPMAGAFSDNHRSRFGKRRPYIFLGALFLIICLMLLPLSTDFIFFLILVVLIFVFTDLTQAPSQGLIPDLVPPLLRGKASGFMSVASIGGAMLGPPVCGLLADRGSLDLSVRLAALILLLSTVYTLTAVKENPSSKLEPAGVINTFKLAFNFDFKKQKDYFLLQLSRFFLLLSLTVVLTFFYFFVRDTFDFPNPASIAGIISALAAGTALLTSVPAASWSDKAGRKKPLYAGGFFGILASLCLITAHDYFSLFISALVFGLAFGFFSSILWAFMVDLVPEKDSARYLGYSQFSTSLAQVAAPVLGGLIIDYYAGARIGYQLLFAAGMVNILVGLLIITRVREPSILIADS